MKLLINCPLDEIAIYNQGSGIKLMNVAKLKSNDEIKLFDTKCIIADFHRVIVWFYKCSNKIDFKTVQIA
jgi:hypothetical protein